MSPRLRVAGISLFSILALSFLLFYLLVPTQEELLQKQSAKQPVTPRSKADGLKAFQKHISGGGAESTLKELPIDARSVLEAALAKRRNAPIVKARQTWQTKRGTNISKQILTVRTDDKTVTREDYASERDGIRFKYTQYDTAEGRYHVYGDKIYLLPRSKIEESFAIEHDALAKYFEKETTSAVLENQHSSGPKYTAYSLGDDTSSALITFASGEVDRALVENYAQHIASTLSPTVAKGLNVDSLGRSKANIYYVDLGSGEIRACLYDVGGRGKYEEVSYPPSLSESEKQGLVVPSLKETQIVNSEIEFNELVAKSLVPGAFLLGKPKK